MKTVEESNSARVLIGCKPINIKYAACINFNNNNRNCPCAISEQLNQEKGKNYGTGSSGKVQR